MVKWIKKLFHNLTVGGVYRKAEIPRNTKCCATFCFSHSLVKLNFLETAIQGVAFAIVLIKQHQLTEYRDRRAILYSSSVKTPIYLKQH